MKTKQLPFFATASDLAGLAREVSSQRPLSFVLAGLSSEQITTVLSNLNNPMPFETYLIFDRDKSVVWRRVPQRDGSDKYAMDQLDNPHTVSLQCGGMLDGIRLIAGQVGTATTHPLSDEIYSLFAKTIRQKFEKIKSYYVGPEAAQNLDTGVRLTPTATSPSTYDLVR
jgi:hypothetical protein